MQIDFIRHEPYTLSWEKNEERTLRTENGGWFETLNTLPVSGC